MEKALEKPVWTPTGTRCPTLLLPWVTESRVLAGMAWCSRGWPTARQRGRKIQCAGGRVDIEQDPLEPGGLTLPLRLDLRHRDLGGDPAGEDPEIPVKTKRFRGFTYDTSKPEEAIPSAATVPSTGPPAMTAVAAGGVRRADGVGPYGRRVGPLPAGNDTRFRRTRWT